MFSISRYFIILFLASLQFIAPLVHAHTHNSFANFGLHVPGLEGYDAGQFAMLLPATSNSYQTDGMVVGVDTGFRQSLADNTDDSKNDFIVPAQPHIVKPTLSAFDANFSPHRQVLLMRTSLTLPASRAPPVSI